MKKSSTLVLVTLLILSTMLIAVPLTICEDTDPVHIYYAGSKISNSPGPIVWTGPCSTSSFTFTVRVQWDALPDPSKVNWATMTMTEKSSFGITFSPLSFTLYNPSLYYQDVVVTVPVGGLGAGTYAANIYVSVTGQGPQGTPKVAGTDGFFQFVKTPCPVKYYLTVTSAHDTPGGMGWYDNGTTAYANLTDGVVSGGTGIQYVFTGWSGDASGTGLTSNPITMSGNKTATANWKTQYYLTVVSPYDTPGGMGWYDECTYANATLTTGTVDIVPGSVRAVFTGWGGDASGTGLISDPIHMDSPKTAIANWKIQYYLTVVTDPSTLPPIPGADWYDNCTWVTLTAPTPVSGGVGVRYRFSYWDVDGTSQGAGVNPINIHINAAHTATAHYIVQYYLTVTTDPAGVNTPSGEGWYDGGTNAAISTDQYVDIVPGSSRYRFDGWTTADMSEITAPSSTSTTVLMDKAKTVTANYVIQYYLTVKTDPTGLVTIPGEGWYDKCTTVTLTAPSVTGYLFVYWDVDGTNTPGNPITVHMDAPHTATAHYWLELEFGSFITDSSFNVITRFDTVWTPKDLSKTTFKLASTNPGQFYFNIKITNNWPVNTGTITVSYTLDPDFIIHPIQGDPIQVWTGYGITGTRIPATVTYGASGTVTISGIAPGQTVYVSIHMQYGPARGYFPKATMLAWKSLGHLINTFTAGYTVTVPGPFPFIITSTSTTTITDPVVVLGLEE